jgi:hypothetical protein
MKVFAALLILISAVGGQAQVVGTGGVFNSPTKPMVMVFTGDDTANIKTSDQAKSFCKAKGRSIANRCAWCKSRTAPTNTNMYDGMKETEEWAPISGINEWLQIGKLNGTTKNTCKTYREAYGIPNPGTTVVVSNITYCVKPENCTESKCAYNCSLPKGYYPDPTDCKAYCHCSGGDGPSWWETVTAADLIWDPYCSDSTPLDSKNKPLG